MKAQVIRVADIPAAKLHGTLEADVLLAWARGTVRMSDLARALKVDPPGKGVYLEIALSFRRAVVQGKISEKAGLPPLGKKAGK